jgi:hypothetical protein
MTQFWVVEGGHAGTNPSEAEGRKEQWLGPFGDYELAREEWQRRSRSGINGRNAARCRIERIDPDTPPACTD